MQDVFADDAYFFMVAWETMALSSFFLVTSDHEHEEIRRAGFLYLLIEHLGAIAILLSFGALQAGAGDYTFVHMRALQPSAGWATAAFLLALVGFGAKAGLVPLHVWLPEAHPAAPSPVSALLSAVMLKTAVYGFLRVTYDLLPAQLPHFGRNVFIALPAPVPTPIRVGAIAVAVPVGFIVLVVVGDAAALYPPSADGSRHGEEFRHAAQSKPDAPAN